MGDNHYRRDLYGNDHLEIRMSQIKNIFIAVIALIIVYFFIQTSRMMGAPDVFPLFGALIVVIILFGVARRLIRGH